MGEQAEALGVDIFPGFAAVEVLYDEQGAVRVATGDMGVARDGSHTDLPARHGAARALYGVRRRRAASWAAS